MIYSWSGSPLSNFLDFRNALSLTWTNLFSVLARFLVNRFEARFCLTRLLRVKLSFNSRLVMNKFIDATSFYQSYLLEGIANPAGFRDM